MDPLADWDFDLPDEHIARRPTERRAGSRLMHLPLGGLAGAPTGDLSMAHHAFSDLPGLLRAGDLLVVNDTRVMAARLRGRRASGGAVEFLVLDPGPGTVRALARPAKKLSLGDVITLTDGTPVTIVRSAEAGVVLLSCPLAWADVFAACGELPLPPYMGRRADDADVDRYQTVFAGPLGAAAAPTAGLHFDADLLSEVASAGVSVASVTLHVGLGTFSPLRAEDIAAGVLHEEPYVVPKATTDVIERTRARGGRVIAVGTTSARTLESAASGGRVPHPGPGATRLFLRPPDRLTVCDGMITNFHLPRSSLLMFVACLLGRERLLAAYAQAISLDYRFYSYGDAMLLL